jgi:hypothetical protein
MKKFGFNFCGRKIFLIFIHCFLLVKATMNDVPNLSLFRKDCLTGTGHGKLMLTKRLYFFVFQLPKAEQRPLRTCQWKKVIVFEA